MNTIYIYVYILGKHINVHTLSCMYVCMYVCIFIYLFIHIYKGREVEGTY